MDNSLRTRRTSDQPPRTRMQLAKRTLYGGEPAEVSIEFESAATGRGRRRATGTWGPTTQRRGPVPAGEPTSTRPPRDPG